MSVNATKSEGDGKEDGKEEKEVINSLNENGNKEEVEGDEDSTKDEEEEDDDDSNNDENEEVILEDSMNKPKSVVSKEKKIKHLSKSKNNYNKMKNKKKTEACNLTGINEDEEDDIREKKLREILTAFRRREEEFDNDDWWGISSGDGWLYEEDNADDESILKLMSYENVVNVGGILSDDESTDSLESDASEKEGAYDDDANDTETKQSASMKKKGNENNEAQESVEILQKKDYQTEAEKNAKAKESIQNGKKDETHSDEPKPEPLSSQAQQKQQQQPQQQNTTANTSPTPSPSPQPKQYTSGRGAFGTIHFTRGKRMDGGWRGVGGRALIVYSQEMEMVRGAVCAPTTQLSHTVGGGGGGGGIGGGGGGATLGVMEMKDLNKEVTRAMQDEFQNEKGKVDDEEAKITQFVWKMRKLPVCAAVDARQTRTRLDLMSALKIVLKQRRAELQRGSISDTQKGKERRREKITATVSEGERDKNIQLEQRAWKKRCAFILKIGIFLRFAEFNCGGFDEEYPSLNLVAPFNSAADLAASPNIALHPLSHCTSSLVNSSLFMNIQQLSSPSLRTS
ncbi:uncharacterized protein MONOS_16389 [Monocercomonoides exilis]|uniref:uncharacterized protein n=1 Tax=Monocercomonoides exilis TaxID=2049356 RepID=UPI00355A0232|nr:hypothetical protein MONOS_16389 [Monocercomonoides exilis]